MTFPVRERPGHRMKATGRERQRAAGEILRGYW